MSTLEGSTWLAKGAPVRDQGYRSNSNRTREVRPIEATLMIALVVTLIHEIRRR